MIAPMDSLDVSAEARRREFLGAFLRTRRDGLTPAAADLPSGFRRRTPGLRRDEVALLAGVGVTWYTWLEQGRDVRASPEVLTSLAKALRLDPAERRHLFALADRPAPERRDSGPEIVDEPIRRLLMSLAGQPAYVLGRRWDILAWNKAAVAVFGDYAKLQGDERNIMHMVFADKAHRRLLSDWDKLAPAVLATFRADCARYAGDQDFERLIEKLMRLSAEFRDWWPKHQVLAPLAGCKRIRHAKAGAMAFEYTSFNLSDRPDMKLIVYTPLAESGTREKLEKLLGKAKASRCRPICRRRVSLPLSAWAGVFRPATRSSLRSIQGARRWDGGAMSGVKLAEVDLPAFGLPREQPELPRSLYEERMRTFRTAVRDAGLDMAIVYADREHGANFCYLTGFDPRFEEALLIVTEGRRPVILTGPENRGAALAAPIDAETSLYPPFGLLGQDRSKTRALKDMLRESGVGHGMRIGVIGWKYYGPAEAEDPATWIEAPAFIVDALRLIAGAGGAVVNAGALMMDCSKGLRAVNEIEQLAFFEFAAANASEAIKRAIFGLRPGQTEFELTAAMGLNGQPHSCHTMLSSGERAGGLNSPSGKIIRRGDRFSAAVGYWGGLSCRAGWVMADASELAAEAADYVEKLAAPYFACAAEWYETIGVGVTGGAIDALVRRRLGAPFFNVFLNPGHLIHLDEWMNSPVYPGSDERFRSGQAIQCDIIPAVGGAYFTTNIEDGVALLDERGRDALAERYPEAWARIVARRAFMADKLGIRLKLEVLPFSNIPAYLPPFLLSPRQVFVQAA